MLDVDQVSRCAFWLSRDAKAEGQGDAPTDAAGAYVLQP
jgi:hypothetical protein